MELYADSVEEGDECPVCYESLTGRDRTLSCQHVFCHDCLVKTLLSISTDGNIRDNIVCPICQHSTFIKKPKEGSSSQDKSRGQLQVLEVPLPGTASKQERPQRSSRFTSQRADDSVATCLGWMSSPVCWSKPSTGTCRGSQVFVIMMERRSVSEVEEAITSVSVEPVRRPRCTCALPSYETVQLVAFILLAACLVILIIIPFV